MFNAVETSKVLINEIMYHPYHLMPSAEDIRQEYIELFNPGAESINLANWQISNGVAFTFPAVIINPREYLVIAADLNTFHSKYPEVSNVIGNWTGRLSNRGEVIELIDNTGTRVDRVNYADEGNWSVRELGPTDNNHRGWIWSNEHDGDGKSLELINSTLSNELGQNWAASNVNEGTPGKANSVSSDDIAPFILDVIHFPIIPASTDTVTVTACIADEPTTGISATLYYRVDTSTYTDVNSFPHHNPDEYNSLTMFDDGAHGDESAGDGIYGAELPQQPNGTVVEFYIEASDAGDKARTWPAPSIVDGVPEQVTNLLYLVDSSFESDWIPGKQPTYYIIMTGAERGRLEYIGSHSSDRRSNAQMNGTFITIDGVDIESRYLASIRNRGKGSRTPPPNNYRINIPRDQPWKGVTAININSKYTYLQVIGSALWRMAGLPAAVATAVQVRVNGENLALDDRSRMYGSYAALEALDNEWASHHFPDDSSGNLYRCTDDQTADLNYEGDNPDSYRIAYSKQTNESDDDWTDLINLTYILNNHNLSDDEFIEQVSQIINIEQWMRYLAVNSLAGNIEGGLNTGIGDDYAMYRGVEDSRFWLVPHDLDTILGLRNADPDRSIFDFYERVAGLNRLLNHPEIVRIYYSQFLDLIDTVFASENLNPLIDQILDEWVPESQIDTMKEFAAERIDYVLEQIPHGKLTVNSELLLINDYHYTTSNSTLLFGTANAITTRSVLVNGQIARWRLKDGTWSVESVTLNPGINRIVVQTFDGYDGTGNELEHEYIDIWYDTGLINDYPKNNSGGQNYSPVSPDFNVNLIVRNNYLPGTPVLVRIELLQWDGNIERDQWDAVARLSVDNPNIRLSNDLITLRNGLGSALITFTGNGNLTLTANVNGTEDNRFLTDLTGQPIVNVSGMLTGDSTIWNGIIHITNDLLVPSGHTLSIKAGTLVLIEGVSSGSEGTDIDVQGTIESLGTALAPVTFTAYDTTEAWGEIHHENSASSTYQYTNITRGGNSPGGGHTGAGPVIRSMGSQITFDHVSITDNEGKVMQSSSGSDLTFHNCQLARSVMGPEIDNTALLFEDSWITEMYGANDNDGIYIHSQSTGQNVTLRRGVIAAMDDDGLDTLGSTVLVEDYIFRDCFDKGVSIYDGTTTLDYVLIVNNSIGISAKSHDNNITQVFVDHATIACRDIGLQAFNKENPVEILIEYFITNSIIFASDSVRTDYDPADIHVDYSNIGEQWPGINNISLNPLFVDVTNNNYHLQENSPCIDAGNDDGTASVQGYYRYKQTDYPEGILTESTTWAPEQGPYCITGELTIPVGVNLTIMPGTTIFFEPDAIINIRGQLTTEGTEYELIRFTRTPGTGATWDGLQFIDSTNDNRITFAVVEYGRTNKGMIGLENSSLLLDNVTFDNTDLRRIRTTDSSLIVSNSVFTNIFGTDEPPSTNNFSEHIWGNGIPENGHFIIENNFFGTTKGHNDAIDFDSPTRPGAIAQILNNVFAGSGDDALDLEADTHIEGNIFKHFHKDIHNTDPGESKVISAGNGKEYVVVRNIFEDIDHVVLVKEDSLLTFVNNTVVNASKSALYFDLAGQTRGPGRGAYVDGSIFKNTGPVFDEIIESTEIAINHSIIPTEWHYLGEGNIDADPAFVNANTDFHLKPNSPAIHKGPCGLDMGAYVPGGAAICGKPDEITYQTNATLTVGGPGVTHYKYSLNGTSWSQERPVDVPIELTNLLNGYSYTVYVIGKSYAGLWQDENNLSTSRTWTVDVSHRELIINEVLAINNSAIEHEGTFPDMIELYYDGTTAFNLSGISLTDNPDNPTKFVFAHGTTINPGQYLVLLADSETTNSGIHLDFALNSEGEGIYLYDSSGVLLDSIEFGLQLPDLSIGKIGYNGHWQLTIPTFGQPNIAQSLGDSNALKINEWLADGHILFEDDFVELFNPQPLPVELSGLHLTDNAITQPNKNQISPLSFIAPEGFAVFSADSQNQNGHVDFKLSANGELLGLLDAELNEIDKILYGPQTTDVSHGRLPDGAKEFESFDLPTPGSGNLSGNAIITANLINIDDTWAYEQTNTALPSTWIEQDYDDSAWPRGEGLLYVENSELPAPKGTSLTIGAPTYYFRKHFNLDAEPGNVIDLGLSAVIDDGAAFYINGIEVLLLRLPSGNIEHTTMANQGVSNAEYEGPFIIPAEYLVRGDNVVAVEVHQSNENSSDIVFGLKLDATIANSNELLTNAIQLLDGLRITELMYHATGGSNLDFIELQNISQSTLDITGAHFSDGIDFIFPQMSLNPSQYVVVVSNLSAFQSLYGMNINVAGEYSGNLSNSGEKIVLKLPPPLEAAILRFEYSDEWYPTTDGSGNSLALYAPATHPATLSQAESWQPATPTPGW